MASGGQGTYYEVVTLDQFIDESIARSASKGYFPTTFIDMRQKHGTVGAIRRLVETSEIQSGFNRMRDLGMPEWSLEAAVCRFPDHEGFTKKTLAYAQARLDGKFDTEPSARTITLPIASCSLRLLRPYNEEARRRRTASLRQTPTQCRLAVPSKAPPV